MMKKTLTAFLFALVLGAQPARAFIMDAPLEQVELAAHFGQLITSMTLYTATIEEATEYIKSVGNLWENAAMKALSEVSSELASFQDKLNFSDASSFASLLGKKASDFLDDHGMKDWREGVESSVDQLTQEASDAYQTVQNTVNDAYQTVHNTVNDAYQTAQNTVNDAYQTVQNEADKAYQTVQDKANEAIDGMADAVGRATETIEETAGKIKDGIEESYNDSFGKKDDSDSSSARVVVVKNNFGQPQSSKKAAEKFIRSRYYYSTKDGDAYTGKALTDTTEANKLVLKNRVGYHQEIVTIGLATAYEASASVKEDSVSRMENLKKKASSVETLDDRRAVEALIVQEEARQRMLNLNLEITLLEKEIVEEMLSIEADYIIARTPEQVTEDTKKKEVEEE